MSAADYDRAIDAIKTLKSAYLGLEKKAKGSGREPAIAQLKRENEELRHEIKALRTTVSILHEARLKDRQKIDGWHKELNKARGQSLDAARDGSAIDLNKLDSDIPTEETHIATSSPPPVTRGPPQESLLLEPEQNLAEDDDLGFNGPQMASVPSMLPPSSQPMPAIGDLNSDHAEDTGEIDEVSGPEESLVTKFESASTRTPDLHRLVGNQGDETPVKRVKVATVDGSFGSLLTPVTQMRPSKDTALNKANTIKLADLLERRWHPSDFVLNPNINREKQLYAFTEVLRGAARACAHGKSCRNCEKFYELVEHKVDGEGFDGRKLFVPPPPVAAMKQKSSRHREYWSRQETPAGFWRSDFANTQEVGEEKAQLEEQRHIEAIDRLSEAIVSGKFMFRDPVLRGLADRGQIFGI